MAEREYGPHIAQRPAEDSLCAGCHSCELICGLVHDGEAGVDTGRIQVELDSVKSMIYTVYSCQHCEDHPCYNACPKKDRAMCLDENNIAYVVPEECIGCGKCMRSCKYTPSRIVLPKTKDRKRRKAKKCDLCRGRAEGPACVEHCFACAIYLHAGNGAAEEMPERTERGDVNHDV